MGNNSNDNRCRICLESFKTTELVSLYIKNDNITCAEMLMACSSINVSKHYKNTTYRWDILTQILV